MAGNMLNQYMDLKRIEFVVTNACTSRCKHCSFGDTLNKQPQHIDKDAATAAVSALADAYDIGSVMTFGENRCYFPTSSAPSIKPRLRKAYHKGK